MLADTDLLKRMLIADGAQAKRMRKGYGPARFGEAILIYEQILKTSSKSKNGVLNRLALAIALEHALPVKQTNPLALENAPETVDPVKRYLHYEKAYLDGELDPTFRNLSVWSLRMVVDGDEPDETLAWGRRMLRNFRPDHIYESNFGWRYVGIVSSSVQVRIGRQKVRQARTAKVPKHSHERWDLRTACLLRPFHSALLRGSDNGSSEQRSRSPRPLDARWMVRNLGPGWGSGWTATRYRKDLDFLASSKARKDKDAFLVVKNPVDWHVFGEKRIYGDNDQSLQFNSLVELKPPFWNGLALSVQRKIVKELKEETLKPSERNWGNQTRRPSPNKSSPHRSIPRNKRSNILKTARSQFPRSPT